MEIEVRVPGKMLLAGEYALLWGDAGLAVALDTYFRVRLRPGSWRSGPQIFSDLWPEAPLRLAPGDHPSRLPAVARPCFVCLQFASQHFGVDVAGVEVELICDWDLRDGLGSSSAMRLGILAAVARLAGVEPTALELAALGHQLQVQAQHQQASGYDFLVQVLGGSIEVSELDTGWPGRWRQPTLSSELLSRLRWLGGRGGAATPPQLLAMSSWFAAEPGRQDSWRRCQAALRDALLTTNWQALATQLQHLAQLGTGSAYWSAPAPVLPPGWMWKPTGAGGGDAALVVWPSPTEPQPLPGAAALRLAPRGMHCVVLG